MKSKRLFTFFTTPVARRIAHGIGRVADRPMPRILMEPAVRLYALGLGVDLREAQVPEAGFSSFGDFFARPLKPGSREICQEPAAFISPCDAVLDGVYRFDGTRSGHIRVKNFDYSLEQLTGDPASERFACGDALVFYLHPRDYHRVHAPLNARLTTLRHIPGFRYPVAPWAERRVPGLYEKNERVVFHFEVGTHHMCLIMVAAFGVGNIDTPFGLATSHDVISSQSFDPVTPIVRAQELGAFRLGSTVVLLATPGLFADIVRHPGDRVLMGQKVGRISAGSEEKI
jgi:phosphatidylserine decarboxylase